MPGPTPRAIRRALATILAALLILGAGVSVSRASSDAAGEGADLVLARVDGEPITVRLLDELLSVQKRPEPGTTEIPSLSPEGLLKRLIQNRLLVQEGYRIGAQDRPEVRNQVWDLVRHRAMLALLDSVSADVPAPDPAEFQNLLAVENVMHRLSHILVADEASARALRDSLESGASFEGLVERHSLDSTFAQAGGDLGWARDEAFIPEFRDAIAGLAKGAVAGPVATPQGWHLLKVTDERIETVGQNEKMVDAMQDAEMRQRVMKRVRNYVQSLREKYGVVVHDDLVATLDFGTADPKEKARLKSSQEPVAVLPWRTLTVSDLDRQILFEHFHGIEGKPNAAEIRDKVIDEWITELLLRHEADALGFDERPEIVAVAERMKREKIRETVINDVLTVDYTPSPEEARAFWSENSRYFMEDPRIRADGVLLTDQASAAAFRRQLEQGARLGWLAKRADGVSDADPMMFRSWLDPTGLVVDIATAKPGQIVGPVAAGELWAVAVITEIEAPKPTPFEECRDKVLALMRVDRSRKTMNRALEQLEAEAEIEIVGGAYDVIAMRLDDWLGTTTTPARE